MARAGHLSKLGFLAACIITGSLPAQHVTGALEGRLVDEQGAAIEGAAIAVSGAALQGSRSAVSDARGRFAVPALPAGVYVATIRRIGFAPVRVEQIAVRLGGTTSLAEIRLAPQAVEVAEVVVSGAKPILDPVSAAASVAIDSAQLLTLPIDRSFQSLVALAPQANASPYGDGVNIGGSTGLENGWYVDGVNVSVGVGRPFEMPFNFVREIQVSTGGYEAEFGRSLSGVVNVVTPSGGNAFQGQVLGYFTSDELTREPRVGLTQPEAADFRRYDVGISLGGPIRRDRLWYFVAYTPTFDDRSTDVGALTDLNDHRVQHLFAGKLTWRVGPRTDVAFTVLGNPSEHDIVVGDVLPATTDTNVATAHESDRGVTVSAQARHELGAHAQLDVSLARYSRHRTLGPGEGSSGPLTRLDDYTTNASSGGYGLFTRLTEGRSAVRAALTVWRGAHAIKLGAEYEANTFDDSLVNIQVVRTDVNVYDRFENLVTARVHNNVPTLFAQDAWAISERLRLSLGMRWESQHMGGASGPDRTVASEWAPRLGIVYQPGASGSQRVFGSAGRFFEQVPTTSQIFWNGGGHQQVTEYPQNPLVDSTNGTVRGLNDYTFVPPVSGLRGQYYDQLSVGYERRLGSSFKVGVRGNLRWLRWVIEDGIAPGDSVYRMGNPGQDALATMPRARQHYSALELSVERATPGPLYLLASYVLSRNTGNYTGLFATDLLSGLPNAGPQYDYPDLMDNADGLLPNDRTHLAKAAASYRFAHGVTLGTFLTVASGVPLSEGGTSSVGAPYNTFIRPRGTAGRSPALWSLDLHGSWDVPVALFSRAHSRLMLDLFNVGNPRRAVQIEQRHYLDNAQTQVNPNYLAVNQYQPPMGARVGMVVGF